MPTKVATEPHIIITARKLIISFVLNDEIFMIFLKNCKFGCELYPVPPFGFVINRAYFTFESSLNYTCQDLEPYHLKQIKATPAEKS